MISQDQNPCSPLNAAEPPALAEVVKVEQICSSLHHWHPIHSTASPPWHLHRHRTREVWMRDGDWLLICQRYFQFIILESCREEDLPKKHAVTRMWTAADWYNRSKLKENWTWQIKHGPGYPSSATSSQKWLTLHWMFFFFTVEWKLNRLLELSDYKTSGFFNQIVTTLLSLLLKVHMNR